MQATECKDFIKAVSELAESFSVADEPCGVHRCLDKSTNIVTTGVDFLSACQSEEDALPFGIAALFSDITLTQQFR